MRMQYKNAIGLKKSGFTRYFAFASILELKNLV